MHKIPKKVECYAAVVKEIIIENCIYFGEYYRFILWISLAYFIKVFLG